MATKIGTGYVSVVPDFSGFQEKVAAKLNQTLGPAMDRAGKNASKRLSKSIGDDSSLRSSLQPLLKRFQKFGDDAGEQIAAKIGKGTKRAEGDMFGLSGAVKEVGRQSKSTSTIAKALANDTFGIASAARDAGKGYKIARVSLGDWSHEAHAAESAGKRLSKGVASLGRDVLDVGRNLKASAGGFGNFEGIMARANRGFQFFRNILGSLKVPGLVAGVALLAQSLSALAAGAFATASALAPLSGALIALPAAALAGAQAFGVLKLAMAGIGDAVKAGITAQVQGGEQATQTLRTQENAAEALTDAHRTLSSCERDAKYAEEDLTKARKEATLQLHEMERAAEESQLTEREGSLALREARRELNKTLREPGATGLDIQSAEQAVERAKFGLESTREEAKKARKDYADANKKGVEGMPEVVSAKRTLADANRSISDAERGVAKAVRDNTDAMEQQGSAATALQQKMAALTPAGRKFAKFLISLKPQFDSLRQVAAKGLLPGAEKGIKSVLGNLGVVKKIVGETSGALGKLAAKAGQKLGSEAWGRDLGKVGAMNTRILSRMGDAGLNVADAFRNILVSAEPLLEWMSKGTLKFSEWLKISAQAGRETGSLAHFFGETREAMEKVWRILKPLGEGLLNVGKIARPLGNEILDSLGDAAEGWAKWTGSIEGQNQLKNYFKEVKPAIFAIGRLVRDLTDDFFELGRQKGVATLVEAIRTKLLPVLTNGAGAITGFFSGFLDSFDDLRKEGVPTFDALIQTLIEHAGEAGVKLAGALWRGFLNAGVVGKLAVGGWLFSKLGGISTAISVGKLLGVGAGEAGASTLATTLGKSLGPALGAVGIANIITSATQGDWKDAGFEAGGALAGGIAGFFLSGGNPLGAAAGVGIGSVLGEALSGLFHSSKKIGPIQEALANSTRGVNRALRGQATAAEAVERADENLREAHKKVHRETGLLRKAEEALSDARKNHDGSRQVAIHEAEVRAQLQKTKKAVNDLRFAKEAAAFAEKAEGRSGAEVVHATAIALAADKGRIQSIKQRIREEGRTTELNEAAGKAAKKFFEDESKYNEALAQVRHNVGAKYAKTLEGMTESQHRFGAEGKALLDRIDGLRQKIGQLRGQVAASGGPLSPFNQSLAESRRELHASESRLQGFLTSTGPKLRAWALAGGGHVERLGGSFESLSGTVSESLSTIQANTAGMLKSFDIGNVPKFTIKYLHGHAPGNGKKYLKGMPELATGGLAGVVPGTSTGDRHVLALNGRPIAKVESREGIFVGNRNMMAAAKQANDKVPRFQTGGLVGKVQQLRRGGLIEPKLEGQAGPLKQLGQAAIHKVFEGAKSVLDKQKMASGGVGAGQLGSTSASGSVADHPELQPGISAIVATILKRWPGLGISSTTGGGHATDSLHYEGRAADLAAPMDATGIRYMLDAAGWIKQKIGATLTEGIHDPNLSIKYGKEVPSSFWGESTWLKHLNHIHVGKQRGGLIGFIKGLQKGGFAGGGYTVKGATASAQQMRTAAEIQEAGDKTTAPHLARVAAEMAATQESNMGSAGNTFQLTGDFEGVSPSDGAFKQAIQWFTKGFYDGPILGAGGGIAKSHKSNDPTLIAQEVEGSAYPTAYAPWKSEGQKWTDGWSADGSATSAGADAGAKEPPKETVPDSYKGVKAKDRIDLGPMAKTLEEINAELIKLQGKGGKGGLIKRYRKVQQEAGKEGKPATAQAIGENISLITARIHGLIQRRTALRFKAVKKNLTERFRKATARFGRYGIGIEEAGGRYEEASQLAEQIVGLEPQQPEIPVQQKGESDKAYEQRSEASEKAYVANYTSYIEQQERPAFGDVLQRVTDWRNTVLGAEIYGLNGEPSVADSETAWEKQTRTVDHRMDAIRRSAKAVKRHKDEWVKKWQGEKGHEGKQPKPGEYPPGLTAQLKERARQLHEELPQLTLKDTKLREAIQEARGFFFPGGKDRLGPNKAGIPAMVRDGSGSFEETLATIQGIHQYPDQHSLLDAGAIGPPNVAGRFGGVIWDVNNSISELGLKVSSALHGLEKPSESSGEGNNEKLELELEQSRFANQRRLIEKALGPTLSQFEASYPLPFAGTFHTGGTIAGPSSQEYMAKVRGAEHVLTPEQMSALSPAAETPSGSAPVIESLVIHHDGSATMRFEGREFESAVQEVVRGTRSPLVGSGANRAFRP